MTTGGKPRLLGISKRGNRYLRKNLIHGASLDDPAPRRPLTATITLPWTAPSFAALKGIVHAPCAKRAMRPESRDALLTAIVKARG